MAVSIFLIITGVIFGALALGSVIMTYVYFSHSDDKDEGILPKIVVIFSLWVAVINVLMLTYDIANSRGDGGGIRMDILWQVVDFVIVFLLVIVIPFSFFYYEAEDVNEDETENGLRLGTAFKFTLGFLFVICVVMAIMYSLLNMTDIPVLRHCLAPNTFVNVTQSFQYTSPLIYNKQFVLSNRFYWAFPVSFPIYVMAMLSFLAWFLFAVFVGIGLMALPVDLIYEFINRPIPMSPQDYAKKKVDIGNRAAKLLVIGKALLNDVENSNTLKNKKAIKLNKGTENRFEQAVYTLKKESDLLFISHKLKGGNPLWYLMLLILGIISLALSVTWLIHIIVFIMPVSPWYPFLNSLFITMEDSITGFPLFGLLMFAVYNFYLLWCCIKGAFRFGMQIPFLFKIYPMEIGKTYLNGFLANSWLIVLCSLSTVQFCTTAFPFYTRNTSVDLLFGSQVRWLRFFREFWSYNVFIDLLLFAAFLAGIQILNNPRNSAADVEEKLKQMANDDDTDLGVD